VLGVAPAIGRAITVEDDRENASVVVLSHRLWSTLGRDPSLIGQTVLLDRRPYTVVGVMPERFDFPPRGAELNGEPAELFVPMSFSKIEREGFGMRYGFTVVARLKPGVSLEQARGEMERLKASLLEQYPAVLQSFLSGMSIPVVPLDEETLGRSRNMLLVLLGAVTIVLLIVCADVANLMLTRFGSRQREIAVRSSLGASPARILRQLLTESLTLGVLGSALGLLFARFAMRALLSLGVETLPRAESIAFNDRVLGFAVFLALLTPLFFGVLPALRSVSGTDAGTLKDSPRTATAGRRSTRLLGTLAVTQVALALVLSVGAGLLLRSFLHLLSTDPGFRSEKSVRATVTLPSGGYSERGQVRSFYDRAIDAARRIPGVLAVGAGSDLPLGVRDRRAFSAEAPARPIPEPSRLIAPTWASPDYFVALGIPLKGGRFFTEADGPERPAVIVNEMLAKMVWPGEDPIGRRIKWGIEASQSPWMTIVGVVGDVKQGSLDAPTIAQVYVPLSLLEPGQLSRSVNLVVRSDRDTASLIVDLRGALQHLDPTLPISKAQPLTEMIGESLRPQRFSMTVVTLFAIVALALAAIGIYGVLASLVRQRTHEIAIRRALGATGSSVIWMILRRTLVLIAAGIGFGVAGALGVTRVMASLLYEVRPTDATAFFGAALVLTLLALLATLAPAWRAIRVDPLVALKTE
jgi:predicted permease